VSVDHEKRHLGYVDDLEVAGLGRVQGLAFLLDVVGLHRGVLFGGELRELLGGGEVAPVSQTTQLVHVAALGGELNELFPVIDG